MSFAAGTQVTEHVQLVRELGRGGMGYVWVGWDVTTLDGRHGNYSFLAVRAG